MRLLPWAGVVRVWLIQRELPAGGHSKRGRSATVAAAMDPRVWGQENEGQENSRMRIRLFIFLSPIFLSKRGSVLCRLPWTRKSAN
jgi:hypothetical protein